MLGALSSNDFMANAATPKKSERPITPEAVRRGELLKALLIELGMKKEELAQPGKLSAQAVWLYLNGRSDLANAQQDKAEALLGALGIPDSYAWVKLEIPRDKRGTFRSFRPAPLGHGDDKRELLDIILDSPLQGTITLPAGFLISVDESNKTSGLQLQRLEDRYIVGPSSVLPALGERVGQLVAIDTAFAPL